MQQAAISGLVIVIIALLSFENLANAVWAPSATQESNISEPNTIKLIIEIPADYLSKWKDDDSNFVMQENLNSILLKGIEPVLSFNDTLSYFNSNIYEEKIKIIPFDIPVRVIEVE